VSFSQKRNKKKLILKKKKVKRDNSKSISQGIHKSLMKIVNIILEPHCTTYWIYTKKRSEK